MPRGDGTGPRGLGPRTGRAAGFCAGNTVPGSAVGSPGAGAGRGLGAGAGRGLGAGASPDWIRHSLNGGSCGRPATFSRKTLLSN